MYNTYFSSLSQQSQCWGQSCRFDIIYAAWNHQSNWIFFLKIYRISRFYFHFQIFSIKIFQIVHGIFLGIILDDNTNRWVIVKMFRKKLGQESKKERKKSRGNSESQTATVLWGSSVSNSYWLICFWQWWKKWQGKRQGEREAGKMRKGRGCAQARWRARRDDRKRPAG